MFLALEGTEQQFTLLQFNPSSVPRQALGNQVGSCRFFSEHQWAFRTASASVGTPWAYISTSFTLQLENTYSKTIFYILEVWTGILVLAMRSHQQSI